MQRLTTQLDGTGPGIDILPDHSNAQLLEEARLRSAEDSGYIVILGEFLSIDQKPGAPGNVEAQQFHAICSSGNVIANRLEL